MTIELTLPSFLGCTASKEKKHVKKTKHVLQIEHNLVGGRRVERETTENRMKGLNQGCQISNPADLTLEDALPGDENEENFQLVDILLL